MYWALISEGERERGVVGLWGPSAAARQARGAASQAISLPLKSMPTTSSRKRKRKREREKKRERER